MRCVTLTELSEPLTRLVPWLEAEDPHARHHLSLLEEAKKLLALPDRWGDTEARQLSARLERWRYQHLNEVEGRWRPVDWELADLLDSLARQLAGRPHLPPRSTFTAIYSENGESSRLNEALEVLNPSIPLEEVCAKARAITEENFSLPVGEDLPHSEETPQPEGQLQEGSRARVLTKRRMFMYAPLYLSSYCVNYCLYCGFRFEEPIERKHLTIDEVRREAEVLRSHGFRHILLVAGDFPQLVSVEYLTKVIRTLVDLGIRPGIEVAPQSTDGYEALVVAGATSITLYQETYDLELYRRYHPRGPKSSFLWRLEGVDRAAEAGMRRLGLGILLGLADPRADLAALIRHGLYLERRYPDRRLAFSLPRIHEAPVDFRVPVEVPDELFIRMYCALRIAFPRAELVLSTREAPELRNSLAKICITQMSAGSSTVPGGYADTDSTAALGRQFPVHDPRSPEEVFQYLRECGFHLIWQLE